MGKPVIIDFYADWCSPCVKLDQVTFHNPKVVEEAEADFVMLKVDLTQKDNPLHEGLLGQYDVRGVPTVVFLDRQGRERQDLRVVTYLPPAQMLERMKEIRKTGS